jgi:hypothetical protein
MVDPDQVPSAYACLPAEAAAAARGRVLAAANAAERIAAGRPGGRPPTYGPA